MYISKDLCRICLNNSGAISIYDKGAQISIIEAIVSITNINILCSDNYPNSVCLSCLDNINSGLKLCEDVKFAEEHLKQLLIVSEQTIIIDTDEEDNSTFKLFDHVEGLVDNTTQNSKYFPFIGVQEGSPSLLSSDFIHTDPNITETNTASEQTNIIEIDTDDDKDDVPKPTQTCSKQTIVTDNNFDGYEDGSSFADKDGGEFPVDSRTNSTIKKTFKRRRKINRMNFANRKKILKNESIPHRNENNLRGSSSGKLYTCHICFEQFLNRTYLLNHKKCHTNDKQYICQVCHNTYINKSSLKCHMLLTHSPSPRARCRHCSKVFSNACLLQNHLEFECVKNHVCGTCGKAFYRIDNMKVHIRTVHLKQKNFKCMDCGKAFGVSSNLRSHVRNVHEKQSFYSFE